MEKSSELWLIMSSGDYRYCFYRVSEPEDKGDERVIYELDEAVMKLHNESCPEAMSFAAVGTNIFMIGGYYARDEHTPFRLSRDTIIFDTLSNTYAPGPPLVSAKGQPFLFTVGSKIYALSQDIFVYDSHNDPLLFDPKPRFEVLNTEHLESGWRALRVPTLIVSEKSHLYSVESCVVASNLIFISVEHAGTYSFDLDAEFWTYVGPDQLPFADHAVSMPLCLNSLCFDASSSSAYNIRLHPEIPRFLVDEFKFDTSPLDLAPPLPPELSYECPLTAFDNFGRVYFIDSGLDDDDAHWTHDANRYVKVQVYDVKLRERRRRKRPKRDSSVGQFLKKCTSTKPKSEFEHHDEVEVEDSGQALRKCKSKNMEAGKKKMKQKKRKNGAKDETVEFKMDPIWRRSFFGGPMFDIWEHVYAAFAI